MIDAGAMAVPSLAVIGAPSETVTAAPGASGDLNRISIAWVPD